MKQKLFYLILAWASLASSCYDDLGNYTYTDSAKVTFVSSVASNYTFTAGTPFEMDAPIRLSKEVAQIDEVFTIEWYLNRKLFHTGYHFKHTFERGGTYEVILKVIHKETGETYLSNKYTLTGKNVFDWGWMVLADAGEGQSSLSFITPDLKAMHHLEQDIEGGLGNDPQGIYYYYVLGSISGSYVSGLPKILINQGSGSVTLDGNSLQKDVWLADEFENRKEPEQLRMQGLAFKVKYYVICSAQGDIYIRGCGYDHHAIPYYGKYGAMPYHFEGGSRITCFAPFHNVTYRCADQDNCLLYDAQHARFIGLTDSNQWDLPYAPDVVYFRTYDQALTIPPGVLRVDDMGAGTQCLAIGAYEKIDRNTPEEGGLKYWSNYVSLIDINGAHDYALHEFSVKSMSARSHLITATDQYPFSGASLLGPNSLVQMASNLEKHPYLYFTDGDRKLYVYSLQLRKHVLAYTASDRITHICASPIVCEFEGYAGNSSAPNFRLALAQADGNVAVVDVSKSNLTHLFEGLQPTVEIATFSGFGRVKGMVWCTNYQGEY